MKDNKAKKEHIDWYDNLYKHEGDYLPSWYKYAIADLTTKIKQKDKIAEFGCGQSVALRFLAENKFVKEENIYGIDQSFQAAKFLKKKLPKANISQGDIYDLKFKNNSFDYILLMETIEHLEAPYEALKEIQRVLKPNGKLYISFPNYFNLPWFVLRILSEKLNRPSWVFLQPLDKIYNTLMVINFCKKNNLKYKRAVGTNYFPPVLFKYESDSMTKFLNSLKLYHLSFHPILIFEKCA